MDMQLEAEFMKVCVCVGGGSLTWLDGIKWNGPVSQEFTTLLMNHNSQRGHFWKEDLSIIRTATNYSRKNSRWGLTQTCAHLTDTHLFKHKRLLVPHWVNGIGCGGPLGAIFLLGVSGQPDHLHLNPRFHIFVGQKLAWIDLVRQMNLI